VFICEAGDIIPTDGEIIEGIATVDESAITGESAPVIREAGGDKSSVTGGTKVLSDRIKVMVTTQPGESFLDKMIALVEGASRQKTPNEIALTLLLSGFTIVFLLVTVTLKPFSDYANTPVSIGALIALFVCLIPTTIGGLLSAIGIAGMDRALQANVISKSGKAVETAGDLDTILLDKTGTITIGNRKATNFYPAEGVTEDALIECATIASLSDDTPEGKSIVELAGVKGYKHPSMIGSKSDVSYGLPGARIIKFTAETRSSGIELEGRSIRKGAFDAIKNLVEKHGNEFPVSIESIVEKISSTGGTPLVVSENFRVMGAIELQDIVKPGIMERFERLRKMGVKTVMVTGDNPLTARYIAEKAGVDDFIAEAKIWRKRFGGGMRQVGILAAAGLIALEESPKRLHIDHENARRLAEGVANIKGVSIDAEKVQTNIVIFDISETGKTSAEICDALKAREIFAIPFGKAIRMVTHCDVSRDDIEKTLHVLEKILEK